MKVLVKRLVLAAFLAVSLVAIGVRSVAVAQETDDPVKIEIYKRFVDNRVSKPSVAYQAARDYLQKYAKDKDQYVDYLTKWVMFYERDERGIPHGWLQRVKASLASIGPRFCATRMVEEYARDAYGVVAEPR